MKIPLSKNVLRGVLAGFVGLLGTGFLVWARENVGSIKQEGYADFAKGQAGNSGANIYVSKKGAVEVINKWDINGDGYPDLLMSNDHDVYETVDAMIYWGSPKGYTSLLPDLWKETPLAQVLFDLTDHPPNITRLPAFGGGKAAIADFNRDGYPDIVFCNYIHYYPGLRSAYLYWGGPDGYSVSHRTELPTNWADGVAAADLNGDGYPDLVFANQGTEEGGEETSAITSRDSYIYWGSPTGFSAANRTTLATKNARDVTVADLNQDGFPDIAFVNNSKGAQEVQIFWGSATGYSNERVQTVPVPDPTSIHAADINDDGFPDLVVTTGGMQLTISMADLGKKSPEQLKAYIFLGSAKGFDAQGSIQLPSLQATDSCIADFNDDGFADIAIANSSNGQTPLVPSYVYWGSKDGFSADHRTDLPTQGARAVACADLNHDGHPDLVFANSDDGKTEDIPSYIYWGSSTGFAPYLRSDLQSFGPADVKVADLNHDGNPDVLFMNRFSGSAYEEKGVNTHIFWGNPHHYYSTASMTNLPGLGTYGTTIADLNDDGYPDIVLTTSISNVSYIYWGGKDGFSTDRRTSLNIGNTLVCRAADLNHDGYLDLVFGGTVNGQMAATILWGSASGYSEKNKTMLRLKSNKEGADIFFQVADLNHDGYLDLVFHGGFFGEFQIFWGGPNGYSESNTWTTTTPYGGSLTLADLDGDGNLDFILGGGFDPVKRTHDSKTTILRGTPAGTPSNEILGELEGHSTGQCAVADLNRDGIPDIVCSNYMADSTRELPIFIFWGTRAGITAMPIEPTCPPSRRWVCR